MDWRLLIHEAAPGAWNMAVDEALLRTHAQSQTLPTIRFYDWQPACLSLGRFQTIEADTASSFDIVRRPTGGRAVWHQHEITYSAVIREELLPPGATSVVGAYRWLSGGLVSGLKLLGIEAALAKAARSTPAAQNCFNSAAQCDFLVEGRKLIGAAQARKHGAILQHGSILLEVDAKAWNRVLGGSMQRSVSLRDLGIVASRAEIIAALVQGLEGTFQGALLSKRLTPDETTLANQLHTEKYSQRFWNREAIDPRI